MADTELPQQVELALAQAKRVRREQNILVQMLGGIRDEIQDLQLSEHKENDNGSTTQVA